MKHSSLSYRGKFIKKRFYEIFRRWNFGEYSLSFSLSQMLVIFKKKFVAAVLAVPAVQAVPALPAVLAVPVVPEENLGQLQIKRPHLSWWRA
jgi:hypothetical protein